MGRSGSTVGAIGAAKTLPLLYDTLANRPAANTVQSSQEFFATDKGALYYSNGANWIAIAPSSIYPAVTVDTFDSHIASHFTYQNGNRLYLRITSGNPTWTGGSTAAPTVLCVIRWPSVFTGFPLVPSLAPSYGDWSAVGDNVPSTTSGFFAARTLDHQSVAIQTNGNGTINATYVYVILLPALDN